MRRTRTARFLLFVVLSLFFCASRINAQSVNLDAVSSTKPLGCFVEKDATTFRLFAPRATSVKLVLFDNVGDAQGREFAMKSTNDGTWEHVERAPAASFYGKYYGYRVDGPKGAQEVFNPAIVVGDPYSKAVASYNAFPQSTRTLILTPELQKYDWQGDKWVIPADHNKLVIYEAHVRDMTAHPSSGVAYQGMYLGLTEGGKTGGLDYLKRLGVNAVELLPLYEFNNLEVPYKDEAAKKVFGKSNDDNLYARNHWGYMTSYFFAPESYYASNGPQTAPKEWSGADGRAVREMKDMVKALHKAGLTVILDVVYNHVSDFDYNPFKYIDKMYYFRSEADGRLINTSGCGNDFKTERAMARRLIIESVKYWMTEYHIDGFRFDLAAMIDKTTCEEIAREARKINPNVILIAEPWGGGKYSPALFSDIGWAAWNDRIRNGVKGQNPKDGLGFIFGKHQGDNTNKSEKSFVNGTLREDGGLFRKKEHSINYLESHDDETMGDFIRLALRDMTMETVVTDINKHARLTPRQLALNKLAAVFLLTAQGPVMLHAGQEFARSKVIAKSDVADPNAGKLDRNSYNKDNETNYINYQHAISNTELVEYYRGLIALRKQYPSAFGGAAKSDITFLPTDDEFTIAFRIRHAAAKGNAKQPKSFIVGLNGNPDRDIAIALPQGKWAICGNNDRIALDEPVGLIPSTGMTRTVIKRASGLILAER